MSYQFIPVRLSISKRQEIGSVRIWRKGNPDILRWDCKLVQPLWKIVQRFLKILKIQLSYDPAIPFLGLYVKEMKTGSQRDSCIPIFIAALFLIAKLRKQPKCLLTDH